MRQIIYLAILRLSTLKDCQYWLSNNNSYLTSDMEISPIFFKRHPTLVWYSHDFNFESELLPFIKGQFQLI